MSGGAGDDTYQVLSLFDSVTESSGSGVDTVVVAGTKGVDAIKWFYLPVNVEHMVLSNQITGFGNALQNIIEGGVGAQVTQELSTTSERESNLVAQLAGFG